MDADAVSWADTSLGKLLGEPLRGLVELTVGEYIVRGIDRQAIPVAGDGRGQDLQ